MLVDPAWAKKPINFRARAKQCRSLARDARDGESRRTLDRMAEELDAEAEVIESEEIREEKRR